MEQMITKSQPFVLSLLRFITGLLLFSYGVVKIFKYPPMDYFANLSTLFTTAGWIELVIGGLLMIGLFSRLAAFILSGEMAFAYFLGHVFEGTVAVWHPVVNNGALPVALCFTCLYLAVAGGGPISVDKAIGRTRSQHAHS